MHININNMTMVSKNISIRKVLYDRLELHKKPGESFSDVIERLLDKQKDERDIMKCFGLWSNIPENLIAEMREHNKEMRQAFTERFT